MGSASSELQLILSSKSKSGSVVLGPLTNLDVSKSFNMKRKRQDDKEEGVDDDEEHGRTLTQNPEP